MTATRDEYATPMDIAMYLNGREEYEQGEFMATEEMDKIIGASLAEE